MHAYIEINVLRNIDRLSLINYFAFKVEYHQKNSKFTFYIRTATCLQAFLKIESIILKRYIEYGEIQLVLPPARGYVRGFAGATIQNGIT